MFTTNLTQCTLFFSKECLWKSTQRAKHVDFVEQNAPREISIQLFREFDSFCIFQLKNWLSLTSWNKIWYFVKFLTLKIWQVVDFSTQNQTLCVPCNSEYDMLWLFSHKICHIVNFLVQSLTGCGNPKSKLDRVKRSNQNLTRRVLFISRPGTLCTLFFKNWQVVIILITNVARGDTFRLRIGTLWSFHFKIWHVVKHLI